MSNLTRPNGSDERYTLPVEASRRGAHRARPSALLGALPIVAVAAVVIALVALAYTVFGRSLGGVDSSKTAAAPSITSTSAGQTPAASAPSSRPTAQQSPQSPQSQTSPTPSAAGSTSSGATTVDKTVTLNFFNGTRPTVPGLSRKAATKFTAAGWKIGTILPWNGAAVTETTVYYAKPEQKATAQAIVKELGVGAAKLSASRAGRGIAVVISNDWTP